MTTMLIRLAVAGSLCLAVNAFADEPRSGAGAPEATSEAAATQTDAKPQSPVAAAPTDAELDEWIKQLDDDAFEVREAAVQKLSKAGKAALPRLIRTADEGGAEASLRAFEVLRKQATGKDEPLAAAASEALAKLAKSENLAIAKRAADISKSIASAKRGAAPGPGDVRLGGGGIVLRGGGKIVVGGGGRIVIGGAGGGGTFSITTASTGDTSTTEVTEGDTKYKVEKNPDGITVTRTIKDTDGKAKTETWRAKDAADLKKTSEEAHKIFERYGAAGGGTITLGGAIDTLEIGKAETEKDGDPKPADADRAKSRRGEALKRMVERLETRRKEALKSRDEATKRGDSVAAEAHAAQAERLAEQAKRIADVLNRDAPDKTEKPQ